MTLFHFRKLMNKSSLRRQLVLPFVLLVIFVSTSIGWVSYRAGENAVDALSERVLTDMVNRIGQATGQHLRGAMIALSAVVPDPRTVPEVQPFSDDLTALEGRLWIASGLFTDLSNYVYFGGQDGRFIGVNRVRADFVELYLRKPHALRRHVFAVNAPGDRSKVLRTDDYDPRVRPWYDVAVKQTKPVWSAVYNDFTSGEPTITLAKAVYRADHSLAGVLATDVTLKALNDFLRGLRVSKNGIAFVMDAEGYMIATSSKELPFKMVNGAPRRLHVDEMQTPLIREAYRQVRALREEKLGRDISFSHKLVGGSGDLEIAAGTLGREYGLEWVTVVAVPRADFMGGVTRSMIQNLCIAVICVVLALVLGLSVLNRILRDIRQLTDAARRIGDGEPFLLNIRRQDEIGQLAMRFSEMEHSLRIDKLTAVFNRASLIAQIGFLRRQLAQKGSEQTAFALLFIDLDHFKSVNDRLGHEAGDRVLATVAARLKDSVRVTDVVARYGGDEFVVLLKGARDAADVSATEKKIRLAIEEPVSLEHGCATVGVSIGWAMFPEDGEDVEALLKIADKRMFVTKRNRKASRQETPEAAAQEITE